MRAILTTLGVLVAAIGIVWILQGINILQVGFMAGHIQYAVFGLIAVIFGLGLIAFANRRRSKTPTKEQSGAGH